MTLITFQEKDNGMDKKFSYALISNQGNEIFYSYDECKKAMKDRTGASNKKFANDDMCRDWFAGRRPVIQAITQESGKVTIYTDGSFNENVPACGWGFVAILQGEEIYTDFGMDETKELLSQRNVAGELMAAIKAVEWAIQNGYSSVELRYDYAGVGDWPLGIQHETDGNVYAAHYRDRMQEMGKEINIQYVQIPGHLGDWYNEKADELAKEGCNIK